MVPLVLSVTGYLVYVSSVIVLICWLLFYTSFEVSKMAPMKKLSSSKPSSVAAIGPFWLSRQFKDLLVDMQPLAKCLFYDSYCRFEGMQGGFLLCEYYHGIYTVLLPFWEIVNTYFPFC